MSIKFENSSTVYNLQPASTSPSVSNNSYAQASGTFDNSNASNLYFWSTVELIGSFASSPTINNTLELYLVPAPSGGIRFADIDVSSTPPTIAYSHFKGTFNIPISSTSSQIMMLEMVPITPHNQKAYIVNKSGQSLNAGWQLNFYPIREA